MDVGKNLIIRAYPRNLLSGTYGSDFYNWNSLYCSNKLIDGHPAQIIVLRYQTEIYFQTEDRQNGNTYKIHYDRLYTSDVENDLEKIIKSSPKSTINEKEFNDKLVKARKRYEECNGRTTNDFNVRYKFISLEELYSHIGELESENNKKEDTSDYQKGYDAGSKAGYQDALDGDEFYYAAQKLAFDDIKAGKYDYLARKYG